MVFFEATGIRALVPYDTERLLAANVEGGSHMALVDSLSLVVSPLELTGGGGVALANVHGTCVLANGHIIAGEYTGALAGGARVNEYDADGVFVRTVYATTSAYGALSNCVGTADGNSLFLIDADSHGGASGSVVRLELTGSSWIVTQQLDMAIIDGGAGTDLWSIALHSDGNLYLGPGFWDAGGGRLRRIIRCPVTDVRGPLCTPIGDTILDDSNDGWAYGLTRLPCDDDLVLATSMTLCRFSPINGTLRPVFDFSGMSDFGDVGNLRSVVAR